MTVATNALKHGTGGLNIDGSRVGMVGNDKKVGGFGNGKIGFGGGDAKGVEWQEQTTGRFPANLIHDGSDEVVGLFPDTGKSTGGRIGNKGSMINTMGNNYEAGDPGFGDSGSAARYFKTCEQDNLVSDTPASCSEKTYDVVGVNGTKDQPRLYYTAKASKSERNAGLEELPDIEQHGHYAQDEWSRQNMGNTPDAKREPTKNNHPTVKPLSLTKYLANLIKPPTGGRLLVPFSGSGSEMIGALQAGWEYVEGVELTEEYIPIAEARIKYWLAKKEAEQVSLL
jgi:site-specific DNA-methyltransferase (adenine-specific)